MNTQNFTRNAETARRFGVHEIEIRGNAASLTNPFLPLLQVTFRPPAGKPVTVDAFYDGSDTWRARVYVSETGDWRWQTNPEPGSGLPEISGSFGAEDSALPGRLLRHPQVRNHWIREDGQPFLNLNDTAYHLFRADEEQWREYVQDVVGLGISSLRVGALGGPEWPTGGKTHNLGGTNYPWQGEDYIRYDLAAFQTSDERLTWLLNEHPDLYLQVILFGLIEWGKDRTGEAWFEIPPEARVNTVRYQMARWAAFPQVFWLIVNDAHCSDQFTSNQAFIREAGRLVMERDPWQHPLAAGPRRRETYSFHPAQDPWSSYVHIETLFDLNADSYAQYADWGVPVWCGEDRYEHDRPRQDPLHPDYFFRCLFWAWLLAGGSASYGGRWRTLTPYHQSGTVPYNTGWGGEDELGYTQRLSGLDSIRHIRDFFEQRPSCALWQYIPANHLARSADPQDTAYPPKLTRRGWDEILVYHPNARGADRAVEPDSDRTACVELDLTASPNTYFIEWFHAATGESLEGGTLLGGGPVQLAAPWFGTDVVLHLMKTC